MLEPTDLMTDLRDKIAHQQHKNLQKQQTEAR